MKMAFPPVDLSHTVARLGPVAQIAWVVDDLHAAIEPWIALGVGPFFVFQHLKVNGLYYGKAVEIDMSAALGYWGEVQIELIVQHNAADSIYSTWRDSGQKGPNHILLAAADFAAAQAALTAAGGVIAQEATIPGMAQLNYFDMGPSRPYIEIGQAFPGMIREIGRMRDETNLYDGTRPVREINLTQFQG